MQTNKLSPFFLKTMTRPYLFSLGTYPGKFSLSDGTPEPVPSDLSGLDLVRISNAE